MELIEEFNADVTEIGIDIDANFWQVNPQIKYLSPFKELYDKDKSHEHNKSSAQMWAVVLYSDPVRSKFYNRPEEERKQEIIKNFWGTRNKLAWEDIQEAITEYPKACLTEKQRAFKSWSKKVLDRQEFMDATLYTEDTFDMLDKMMKESEKIWEAFRKVEEEMIKEMGGTQIKGGRIESKSERGDV